ncbi:MAG: Butyryl-CoA dehydrogenase [Frankiales bacterium]|jgi:acyl-CoA dehydrogenase|nr:Butyryl-CoA dehydrogenase [Frankiales bacterium]
MRRTVLDDDHRAFADGFGRFLDAEVVGRYDAWQEAGRVPREVFDRLGELGYLGMAVPDEHGGGGSDDFRFNAVLNEQACLRGLNAFSLSFTMQNDVALPYFLDLCTDEQRARWLPAIASGRLVLGIAMSEPGAGSDLAGVRTRARRSDDGYRVSGQKTFITNGLNADLIITVVRTGESGTHADLSLLVVENGIAGYERGRKLDKLGMLAQDTCELFFDEALVPAENLLGKLGQGFRYLTTNLAQERLSIAIGNVASARGALERTLTYVKDREAFGRPVGTFQNSRFALASCKTEVEVTQAFVDACLRAHVDGELSPEDAAMAKLWASESLGRVVDTCLQLHGGYGYTHDYAIARDYADARVARIYGGSSEIMREIVGRSLGLGEKRT